MPKKKTFAKFISDKLTEARWPNIEYNENTQTVTCPAGTILTLERGEFTLGFWYYNSERREYKQRDSYSKISFPKESDIRSHLYFKRSGQYKLSAENQFKNIINPFKKSVNKIKISSNSKTTKYYSDLLVIPLKTFKKAMKDAKFIQDTGSSYRKSTENYLSNIKSREYNNKTKKRTTYVEKGEFKFLVDKLYIETKKSKKDFERYIDQQDLTSIEELFSSLFKGEVFSNKFLTVLNEYFIKQRLQDIINTGREILSLGTTNLHTAVAKKLIEQLQLGSVGQLETLWQKFFENYLLYLIFTYKKIFPKVELTNIDGDKKYPDFIGINHYNGLDIIEIKTHLKAILVWDSSHENFYFSPEMSKAIVQTTNYMDAIVQRRFQKPEDREHITNSTDEENLYHPRGIIVISSTAKLTSKKGQEEKLKRDFTKLRNSLNNIEILTFDEILNIADEYIKNIVSDKTNDQ